MKLSLRKLDLRLRRAILSLVGILLAVASVVVIFTGDRILNGPQVVEFVDPNGDLLVGTYYPGRPNAAPEPAGIMLLEGFGSDQVTLRSISHAFVRFGVHVFTFDFSGHGRSPGTLGFDNAATDRLAQQVLAAKETFKDMSGLHDGQIILLGHSMGARVALQAATLDSARVRGLILLGTQLNLATNVQSQVFTGVSDADLDWVQRLGPANPPVNILLLSGQWDDILKPPAARQLLSKLSGIPDATVGKRYGDPAEDALRTMEILPGLFHNYEVYSGRVLEKAVLWAAELWGLPSMAVAGMALRRIILWITALIGVFLGLVYGGHWLDVALPRTSVRSWRISITNLSRFLRAKLLLWLAALPLTVLLFGLFYVIPIGLPAFNLIYVGFIGAYGCLLGGLYALGKMPGVEGRLPFVDNAGRRDRRIAASGLLGGFAVGVGLLLFMSAYARTGWFFAPPIGDRLWWLIIFTPVTALGFWIGSYEADLVSRAIRGRPEVGWFSRWSTHLIGLVPFILYAVFQLSIGSISGLLSSLQGLLILAMVLLEGRLIRQLSGCTWLAAVLQSVLLYSLILPQGVLFSP